MESSDSVLEDNAGPLDEAPSEEILVPEIR